MYNFFVTNIDYIFLSLHFILFIADVLRSIIHNRSIKKICNNCFRPVIDGENHSCSDEEILSILSAAIKNKEKK